MRRHRRATFRNATLPALALLCLAFGGDGADAGPFRRHARTTEAYRYTARSSSSGGCCAAPTAIPVRAAPTAVPTAAPTAVPTDPGGVLSQLNAIRARHGLGPVVHDSDLSSWAATNNAHQRARGLGHYVYGPARRQNSATGPGDPLGMWMGSAPHRAALLDPSITRAGLAFDGANWTFNGS